MCLIRKQQGFGKSAKIIEFAAVRYDITKTGLKETHKMDLFLNPQETLSEKIVELTGITDKLLEDANTENVEAPGIFSFMNSADIWGSIIVILIFGMMDLMSERVGIPYKKRPCLDVLKMARDFIKKEDVENHKLQTVLQAMFPGKTFRFHQAIDDVRATALIMAKFIHLYQSYEEPSSINRHTCRLNFAYYCINPNQKSQVRIKLELSEGELGDIYWDVIRKIWSCKKQQKPDGYLKL